MPPRKKPSSMNKKKADRKLKRAIKQGIVEAPEKKRTSHRKRPRVGPTGHTIGPDGSAVPPIRGLGLQSAFTKLSPQFLEESKRIASNIALTRPLPPSSAIYAKADPGSFAPTTLTCISRPKWNFNMTKTEVEKNEEGVFKKWLAQNDQTILAWQEELDAKRKAALEEDESPQTMPASPTYFERNIEVWRQLWRVTEISEILLILIDSRCPDLHFPPSLASYLKNRKIILVLTKVDITGAERTEAWKAHIHAQYPTIPIVEVESYIPKDQSAVHQGRGRFQASIPENFRVKLIDTIKKVHAELLEPPAEVKSRPERLKNWIPPVKPEVNWDALVEAKGDKVGLAVGGPSVPRSGHDLDEGTTQNESGSYERRVPEILTVGLIGQPNVGKSSLLNALFGVPKVTASKTPGKTKHFQTLFWTQDVRLVDCPGLVFPNFVPMELQVLAGTLPISRVSAISACIHYASQRLPLERIYQLRHPSLDEDPKEDKRTWRGGQPRPVVVTQEKPVVWTAMDILTVYATTKGWVTAKAGRPDIHRAGNAMLRSLAEGRVSWGFWPPGTESEHCGADGAGVWISDREFVDSDTESEQEPEDEESGTGADSDSDATDGEESESEEEEESNEEDEGGQNVGIGRFGALAIDLGEESEASEE
ncbi:GTPase [Ephemerocybe angulata]|uniref:Guanine nucleotide-binding protein-like 1 n=1 Tax=Ephemerocybe angulata TaxID=980116 RepID=A0A8H6MFA7_9AGAR|nr:GTPase [Tulosesus angulatus]